jgi:hypothetical protein
VRAGMAVVARAMKIRWQVSRLPRRPAGEASSLPVAHGLRKARASSGESETAGKRVGLRDRLRPACCAWRSGGVASGGYLRRLRPTSSQPCVISANCAMPSQTSNNDRPRRSQ